MPILKELPIRIYLTVCGHQSFPPQTILKPQPFPEVKPENRNLVYPLLFQQIHFFFFFLRLCLIITMQVFKKPKHECFKAVNQIEKLLGSTRIL